MADKHEIERIALAANAHRPDWPVSSLVTLLSRHAGRPYLDLAVAMTVVACDPATRTPARINEAGPWWVTVKGYATPAVGPGAEPRCTVEGHEHELARNCRCCRAERLAGESE